MPTVNETITASAALMTVVVAGYTAWTGFKGKGKDQHLQESISSYDQLQEDNKGLRDQLAEERARADRERARADSYHDDKDKFQDARHDLRSILRQAFGRMMEAGLEYKDLAARAEEVLSR